jgi:hypothetical protein
LIGLTSLVAEYLPMPPKFNRRRAVFVLEKIDEILAWEQQKETERDTKFVELARYLCEVRAVQYRRLESLKCFDEFLERRFPESRRKAYYLIDPRTSAAAGEKTAKGNGMGEGDRAGQAREAGQAELRLCNLVAQSSTDDERGL